MPRSYLLIDDNREFLENVAEILRDTGAEITLADDGAAALELVRRKRFDAVVTDMRMPGMTGAELLQAVRRIDPGLPVILLSAFSQDAQLRDARRNGLLAVLSKTQQVPRLIGLLDTARRGGTLVLVEDDPELAENLTEALSSRGLTVATASNLGEVDHLGVEPFVALVDLRVPGGTFGESLERIRARFPNTPTVVITAYAGTAPECTAVFHKPFDTGELVAQVEALYQAAVAS